MFSLLAIVLMAKSNSFMYSFTYSTFIEYAVYVKVKLDTFIQWTYLPTATKSKFVRWVLALLARSGEVIVEQLCE